MRLRAGDKLQHGIVMWRDPSRDELRVGELASPEQVRRSMQEYWTLLGEVVSRGGIVYIDNQHRLADFAVLVGVCQQFGIQVEGANFIRADYGSLPQLRAP